MAEVLIRTDNCSFAYEDAEKKAVHDVSMQVYRGEFLAVLGHNGSGKSTLAKLLNALYVPTEGSVTVQGIDTREEARVWDIRQQVGMVFQNPDNQLVATVVEEDVDKTQFIVITHRRGTMEAANRLYGVTMKEKGISRILAIDVSEIEKHI